jgi:hypothetical protein
LCAADCENNGRSQIQPRPAEHCAKATAQPFRSSDPDQPSTERRTPSSQDGSDCEHGHRVCAAVDHSRAELNATPFPVLALEPQPRCIPLQSAPLVRHDVEPQAGPPDSAPSNLPLRV